MTDTSINFCCAPAGVGKGANLGMRTVDFAAYNTIKRLGINGQIKHPWPAISTELGGTPELIELDRWPSSELEVYEQSPDHGKKFVYWGDFQHGFDYQTQSAKRYLAYQNQLGNNTSDSQALDWCYKYFLQENSASDNQVASFGTTLFQNSASQWGSQRYKESVHKLISRMSFCSFRDPYSAWSVRQIRNDFESNYHGIDAAMLNTKEELLGIPNSGVADQYGDKSLLGLYFGRSTKELNWMGIRQLVKQLSSKMDLQPAWIPWGRNGGGLLGRRPKISRLLLPKLKDFSDEKLMSGDILSLLSKCRLIVTDTYHLCINAICLGIPAICIYQAAPQRDRDANMGFRASARDKRALLFLSTNNSDFLLPASDLKSKRHLNNKIGHLSELMTDKTAMANWAEWFNQERRSYRSWIDQKIIDLVAE